MAKEPFGLLEGAMLEGTGNTYVATHACAHPPQHPHMCAHTHTHAHARTLCSGFVEYVTY